MKVKPDSTEAKIIASAREVFKKKGFAGARMEEIAQEAEINKAMLHYYYRSKQKLFENVFAYSFREFFQKIVEILNSEIPLDSKIYKLVDFYTSFLLSNRDLPIFILSELRFQNLDSFVKIKDQAGFSLQNLELQLAEEHRKGNIIQTNAISFFQNVIGLTVFPFVSEPLLKNVANMNDEQFIAFVKNRKKEIPTIIIGYLKKE